MIVFGLRSVGILVVAAAIATAEPLLLGLGAFLAGVGTLLESWRAEYRAVAPVKVAGRLDRARGGDDVDAVKIEFMHRTRGDWLDRDPMWLVNDVAWLEGELDVVLGLAKRETPVGPLCQLVNGEAVIALGCPGCHLCFTPEEFGSWMDARGLSEGFGTRGGLG